MIASSNPTFAQYYRINQDAGPTYRFGTYDTPANFFDWFIQSSLVGDFLGRGAPQVLLGGWSTNQLGDWQPSPVRLLLSGRDGKFADAGGAFPNAPMLYLTRAMVAADFNGDGRPDAFLANHGIDKDPFSGEMNSLLLSSVAGPLANVSSSLPGTPGFTHTAAAGALAGDGIRHVYVGNICCGDTPYFLMNDGKGNFVKNYSRLPVELQGGRTPRNTYTSAALIDLNNDGFPDLVLGAESSADTSNRIYLNDGHGSFANSKPIDLPPGCFDTGTAKNTITVAIAAADLRHSGKMDLILNETTVNPFYRGACIQILINEGMGHFTDQTLARGGNVLSGASAGPSGSIFWYVWTFVVDVNGDGHPDLVLAPSFAQSQTPNVVLLNDGFGYFTPTPWDFFPLNRSAGNGAVTGAQYMIPVDLRGDGKIGFVQPYQAFDPATKTVLKKFAVYEQVQPLLTPKPPLSPVIESISVANGGSDIAQNTWIVIKGRNLVPTNTPAAGVNWSSAPEFASGRMPTQLGEYPVTVTVNNKPAYLYFFCSAATSSICTTDQINVLTPLDSTLGAVPVVGSNGVSKSAAFTVNMRAAAPSFPLVGATHYVVATHADYSLIGPASLSVPGYAFTPGQPGETIVFYAFGFSLPTTSLGDGSSSQSGLLPTPPMIQIGGAAATVSFAGLISPGLYQFNVILPSTLSDGDNVVTCTYNGFASPSGDLIAIHH